MSWHYLPELAEGCSQADCSAGVPSARWRSSPSAGKCCCGVSGTVCSTCSRSGTTRELLTGDPGVERWISSLPDSRASLSALPESGAGKATNGTCGRRRREYWARWDRDSRCWKMFPALFETIISARSLETWQTSGLMRGGMLSRQRSAARPISGRGCGYLPTPSARDWKSSNASVETMQRNARPLNEVVTGGHGGRLNPDWVEWLMGWPVGWTALEQLGTDRCRQWLSGHGNC
jgi:hypothetical protein